MRKFYFILFLEIFIIGAFFALLPVTQSIIWAGSFFQAEYVIAFQGPNNRPLEGIRLNVTKEDNKKSYSYPITDFYPGHTPTSDKDGNIIFHHVGKGVEFSGRCKSSIFGPYSADKGCQFPVFFCHFFFDEREVYVIRFNDLNSKLVKKNKGLSWEELPKVRRKWHWPWQLTQKLPENLVPLDLKESELDFAIFQLTVKIPGQ